MGTPWKNNGLAGVRGVKVGANGLKVGLYGRAFISFFPSPGHISCNHLSFIWLLILYLSFNGWLYFGCILCLMIHFQGPSCGLYGLSHANYLSYDCILSNNVYWKEGVIYLVTHNQGPSCGLDGMSHACYLSFDCFLVRSVYWLGVFIGL